MNQPIPTASLLDTLRFNLFHVLPYFLQGIFTRNRRWTAVLEWLRLHPFSVRFCNHLKRRYGNYVYIRMLQRKSLVVLDVEGVRHVLDHSPDIYAETEQKRRGFGHFQPDSATISRGDAWRDRRQFNEDVLHSGEPIHPQAGGFLEAIHDAVETEQVTDWQGFEELFDAVMLQIVLGRAMAGEEVLSQDLTTLMRRANNIFARRPSPRLAHLRSGLRSRLHTSDVPSLVALCPHARTTPITKPVSQVPHWMFAIRDTLAANAARTMALIAVHTEQAELLRQELAGADLQSPAGIDALSYLEGCLQEAMRLWPTTPLLVRETVCRDTLANDIIPARLQVLIFNNFHHRDTRSYRDADRFRPEFWKNHEVDYRFNHFSNGRQVCAGKRLALFLAKAVLASLLVRHRYELLSPALDPQHLPYTYNYYKLRFATTPASH